MYSSIATKHYSIPFLYAARTIQLLEQIVRRILHEVYLNTISHTFTAYALSSHTSLFTYNSPFYSNDHKKTLTCPWRSSPLDVHLEDTAADVVDRRRRCTRSYFTLPRCAICRTHNLIRTSGGGTMPIAKKTIERTDPARQLHQQLHESSAT
jgi:hypothetical protein